MSSAAAQLLDRPGPGDRGAGRPGRLLDAWTAVVAAVVGLSAAWAAHVVVGLDGAVRSMVVAVPLGLLAGAVAAVRFEWFVLGLLAARSTLDVFDSGWGGGGALDPAASVAILFAGTGLVWLLVQWRAGLLVRPAAPTIALWALMLAGIASVIVAPARGVSLEWNLRLLAGVAMFTVVEQLLRQRPAFVGPLVGAVVVSLVVPAGVAFYQAAAGSGTASDGASRIQSTFAHPNPFATYLVTVLLLCVALSGVLRGGRRAAVAAAALAAGSALVLTQARGAWAAAVVGLLLLGAKLDRRVLWLLGTAVVAAVVFVPTTVARVQDLTSDRYTGTAPANSLEWRLGYWEELIEGTSGYRRLNGLGLEQVQVTTSEQLQPHNVFVQTYVELGVFGLVALIAVIVTLATWLVRRARAARHPLDVALAWGGGAVALALVVQFLSENLLTNVVAYWYAAAAMTYGYRPTAARPVAHPAAATEGDREFERAV